MPAVQTLKPDQRYRVVAAFVDYDRQLHPVGETWTFRTTNFLPYEDGLALDAVAEGLLRVYRLQWRAEEQAAIIENFTNFVVPC